MPPVGQILWMSPLPAPCPPEVLAWSGEPPRPFFQPALAAGFELVDASTPACFAAAVKAPVAGPRLAFLYTLAPWHFTAIARHARRIPFVLYYQNAWPEKLPWLKRLAARFALNRARLVLLQDRLCLERFSPELGPARTLFFPWHVDDTFFDPALCRPQPPATEPWLFVPGDRARLDDVVMAIARLTGWRVLRVSRFFAPGVLEAYAAHPNVEVRHFVPWAELRDLYASASAVLNVVDDGETSAGMTTLLEALALNARLVTPTGHCSAGFCFADGHRPYHPVERPRDPKAWVAAIEAALKAPPAPVGRKPRDLFVSLAGNEACAERWRTVFRLVT